MLSFGLLGQPRELNQAEALQIDVYGPISLRMLQMGQTSPTERAFFGIFLQATESRNKRRGLGSIFSMKCELQDKGLQLGLSVRTCNGSFQEYFVNKNTVSLEADTLCTRLVLCCNSGTNPSLDVLERHI